MSRKSQDNALSQNGTVISIRTIPTTNLATESRDVGFPVPWEMAQNTTIVQPDRTLCHDYISTLVPLDLLFDIVELLGPQDRLSLMRTSRDMHEAVKTRMWRRGPDSWDSAELLEISYKDIIGGYNIAGLESSHAGALIYAFRKRRYEFAYRALQTRVVSPELVRSLVRPAALEYGGALIKLLRLLLAYLPDHTDVINRPAEGVGRLPLLFEVGSSRSPRGSSAAVLRLLLRRGGNPNLNWNGTPLLLQLHPSRGRCFSRLLVRHGADVLQPNGLGMSTLRHAAWSNREYLLPHLINAGVDVLAPWIGTLDQHGNLANTTALWQAVRWRSLNVVRALLRLGADPERRGIFGPFAPDDRRLTDDRVGVCCEFLDHGVPVDGRGPDQCTMLILAAKQHAPKMIRMLLERGANPMLKDTNGSSALDWLYRRPEFFNSIEMHDSAVHLILAGCSLKQKQRAAEEKEEDGEGKHDGDLWHEPPWRIAIGTGYWSLVTHVLRHQRRYDPCARDSKGMTLLMHAGRTQAGSAIWGYDFAWEKVPWWSQRSEATTARDNTGKTALYWAVAGCDRYLCWRLLRDGSDPNARDSSGLTLLNLAARGRDPVILEMLLRHGSDVNAEDSCGRTALSHTACNEPSGKMQIMVRLLMAAGAHALPSDAATKPMGSPQARVYKQEDEFSHAVQTWPAVQTWHLREPPFDRSNPLWYPQKPEWEKKADQVVWSGRITSRMGDVFDESGIRGVWRGSLWDRDDPTKSAEQLPTNSLGEGQGYRVLKWRLF